MKFFDAIKMALHNIWHNKSRTILTLVIVFIVGTLLMVLNIFALAFSENLSNVSREVFNSKGTGYNYREFYEYDSNDSTKEPVRGFNQQEMDLFFDKVEEYSDVIDELYTSYMNINSGTITLSSDTAIADMTTEQLTDYYRQYGWNKNINFTAYFTSFIVPANGEDNFILDGRAWNKNDRKTSGIWISENFAENIYKSQSKVIGVGDELFFVGRFQNLDNDNILTEIYQSYKLTVKGIIDTSKTDFEQNYGSSAPDIFVDLEYLISAIGVTNVYLYGIDMSYKPSAEEYDFNKIYSRIEEFENAFSGSQVRQLENSGLLARLFPNKRFTAYIVTEMGMSQMIGGLVIGLIIAISLVIVLLSAGSIANSIIISTDKNKKFIGLMKALGLKNKGVNRIVNLEASIQILIGVFVSFGIMLMLKNFMLKILTMAFGSIFKMMAEGVEYTLVLNMPLYVPIAVFGVFLLFALLSARGSLRALGKMDVIAIMSEAA